MVTQVQLKTPPTKEVNFKWDQPNSTFKLVDAKLGQLSDGELLVRLVLLSNDPTQRIWIAANQDASRVYAKPIEEGDVVKSLGVGQVVESKSEKYKKGDYVRGLLGWGEEVIVPDSNINAKVDTSLPFELYLSTIGLTGLTAYFGLVGVGHFKEGQSILVSAASGATGSVVVQLAKHVFKGSKVIGIAGSAEKCKWVESLGADYCANYREEGYLDKLSEYIGNDYVDVYFDNVGGETLDFALKKVKRFGRVVACGAIAGYNDQSKLVVNNWKEIISNRLTIEGFIASDFVADFPKAIDALIAAIKQGKIKTTEGVSLDDVSHEGNPWEKVPEVWHRLFTEDKPRGKLLTRVASD